MSEDPPATEVPAEPSATVQNSTPGNPKQLSRAATAVAISAIGVWALFTVILCFYVGRDELQWSRLTWLFGSVQAIAFAGAGALFGTVVQKDRADQAEKRAESAQADADAQRDAAVKGRALASVLQAEATDDGHGAKTKGLAPMGPGQQPAPQADVRREHAQLSRALFGDLVD